MRRLIDYIFIFLIGYQGYFIMFLIFTPAPNQIISLGVSFLSALFSLGVWAKKGAIFSPKHVNMAVTTGLLSLTSILVYIVNFAYI